MRSNAETLLANDSIGELQSENICIAEPVIVRSLRVVLGDKKAVVTTYNKSLVLLDISSSRGFNLETTFTRYSMVYLVPCQQIETFGESNTRGTSEISTSHRSGRGYHHPGASTLRPPSPGTLWCILFPVNK